MRKLLFLILFLPYQSFTQVFNEGIDGSFFVYDQPDFLTETDEEKLQDFLEKEFDPDSFRVGILITDNIGSFNNIQEYATSLVKGLFGYEEKPKRTILILVSKEPREARIQLNFGAQAYINNDEAQKILDKAAIPRFKKGNFYKGISAAANQLSNVIQYKEMIIQANPVKN